jgi:EAL domain-containing protein (putative c-di-GMP-specific phosphodiesterase class I)
MLANQTNIAIVRTIVELARSLEMDTIAEWVEDCATLEALQQMGVDYVQGFVVSKAKPPADILNATTIADLVSDADTLTYIERRSAEVSLLPAGSSPSGL